MLYSKPSITTLTFAELENAKITAFLNEAPVEGDFAAGCECQCQCQCQCQSQGDSWWDWIARGLGLGGLIG